MNRQAALTLSFDSMSLDDLALVGGKNASLGELTRSLPKDGIGVPPGFAVTTEAFRLFLDQDGLREKVTGLLEGLDKSDMRAFQATGQKIRDAVLATNIPEGVADAIRKAYRDLSEKVGRPVSVAVRSSATAEDLPGLSFAGQHDSYLFIEGEEALLDATRRCFASLYNDRAISYRIDQKVDHMAVAISVGVQMMVHSDTASAGVIFTLDPETGSRQSVLISAVYGTGEGIVQGIVEPDEYYVHKATFNAGYRTVYRHKRGAKLTKLIGGGDDPAAAPKEIPVPTEDQSHYCLSDDEIMSLADAALAIESHYSSHYGHETPMDIEWGKDGVTGTLYILQARPETVESLVNPNEVTRFTLKGTGPVITSGRAVGKKIASGTARRVLSKDEIGDFQTGDILIAKTTSPDWEPIMKRAAAIVTDHGGRTCHSAIVSRELGIPAVVGTGNAMAVIKDGMEVTVNCAHGETGEVLDGLVPFSVQKTDIGKLKRPQTEIMVNIADPEQGFQMGMLPSDGVGLARIEFIITHAVGVHPMALLHPDKVTDVDARKNIEALTRDFPDGGAFFVNALAEGVAAIAASFHPRQVIVRMSDFKTNEYAALLGGADFERAEDNPMIGFRGAARYIHPDYAEAFALECAAIKRVREDMGLTNVKVMIPFCRSIHEAESVLRAMESRGLKRGENGLQVYIMCEIPSNVLSIDEFAKRFDGFSIGSNDLTQLVLGVDRDSAKLADTFNERDPAVKKAISMAIEGAHRGGRHIGICGQAPSDYPDFTRFLVEAGIDSISVTSDSFFEMFDIAARAEADLPVKKVVGD
ncbi:phosphoenolpyruvate synthase [Kordiimonas marina]|uniref:phosphoenolpyruvate synthase n=1 Tax=Kordiimonas marina TaxID=2872312 RepID=UPI00248BB065|nr:phosphoenolpyruvate synthase [Kordiimonas marina]MCJ9428838.1 phosphoenolpyruvate synthase [Kordiimonas marina]